MQLMRKIALRDITRYTLFLCLCVSLGWMVGAAMLALSLALTVLFVDLALQIHSQFRQVRNEKIGLSAPPTLRKDNPLIKNRVLDEMVFHLKHKSYVQRQQTKKNATELRQLYNMLNKLSYGLVILDKGGIIHWTNAYARRLLDLKKTDHASLITMFVRTPAFVRFFENQRYGEPCIFTFSGRRKEVIEAERLEYGKDQDILLLRNITQEEQKQQMHKRFLANASHEMQSPLTVIRGNAELALERARPRQRKQIKEILEQVDNMSGLMRSLMLIARIDETHSPEDPCWLNPTHTIRMAGQMAARECGAKNSIDYRIAPGLEIWFNQNDLFIILRNLVCNALVHGKSKRSVQVSWRLGHWKPQQAARQYALLEVRDFGKGISEEELPKIGKRFHQLASHKTRSGHGLGLSIVKGLLRLYKGRLIIRSTPDEGSRFICVLNAAYTRTTIAQEEKPAKSTQREIPQAQSAVEAEA